MEEFISNVIDSRKDMLTDLSDRIWEYAETCFQEYQSADALMQALKEEGFTVTEGIDDIPTAFTGTYGSGHPVIAILGEFDALNNMSQKAGVAKEEPLEPGKPGHGCGHNLLGVGSLAGAIAVKEYLKEHPGKGTIVYFGTPAEEGGSGKTFLARDGYFKDIDIALTWHPFCLNQVRTRSALAVIQGKFTFTGRSAHASAAPHLGRSALDAVELMSVGTQYMREHVRSTVRVHSAIVNAGGSSPNVVPAKAEVVYLCRDVNSKGAIEVYNWLCDIARGAAQMTQTKVDISIESFDSNIINNTTLENLMEKSLFSFRMEHLTEQEKKEVQEIYDSQNLSDELIRKLCGDYGAPAKPVLMEHWKDAFYDFPVPNNPVFEVNPASTDVGDVSWVCPTAQFSGCVWAAWTGGHSWQVVSQGKSGHAHKGMLYAGKVLAHTAISLIEHPETVEEARNEWKERVEPYGGYQCLLPPDFKPVIKKRTTK